MGMFYLLVIARTDRNNGKYWVGTKVHRLAGHREHKNSVSGSSGNGEAAAQHPWEHREKKDRVGT